MRDLLLESAYVNMRETGYIDKHLQSRKPQTSNITLPPKLAAFVATHQAELNELQERLKVDLDSLLADMLDDVVDVWLETQEVDEIDDAAMNVATKAAENVSPGLNTNGPEVSP